MSVYHIVTINWWETNISVGLPAVVTGVTASGPAMSLSTATCEVLKVCGPLLEQHRDQIGLTFYRWPHICQYLFISIYIKETIRVCVHPVRKFFVRHTQLQKSLIRRIDSANKY